MEDILAKNKHFLMEVEQSIRLANTEVIHQQITPITSERMLSFAITVAKLRVKYIKAAFNFADALHTAGNEGEAEMNDLTLHRRRFEEARDSFIVLQRAIEIGYVAVE